jgi:hypothetical protein
MNKGDDFVKEVLRRRGQITVFDVHRPMRPPKTIGGRRLWWITTPLSLGAGLIAAWTDIAGGASWDRVVTIWMVAAGATYFVISLVLRAAAAVRRLFHGNQ